MEENKKLEKHPNLSTHKAKSRLLRLVNDSWCQITQGPRGHDKDKKLY